jgi:hypothetical protein
MKRNKIDQNGTNVERGVAFRNTGLASCRNIFTRIARAKETFFNESYQALKAHKRLLRQALNEAEAVAWQTMYPHLVFPVLATEKIQAVIASNAKLQALRRTNVNFRPRA